MLNDVECGSPMLSMRIVSRRQVMLSFPADPSTRSSWSSFVEGLGCQVSGQERPGAGIAWCATGGRLRVMFVLKTYCRICRRGFIMSQHVSTCKTFKKDQKRAVGLKVPWNHMKSRSFLLPIARRLLGSMCRGWGFKRRWRLCWDGSG